MRRKLLDILACPIDKHYPLRLIELEAHDDVVKEGVLVCDQCNRFYPITEEIPVMLPDDLRSEKEDTDFLARWKERLPREMVQSGRPHHLA